MSTPLVSIIIPTANRPSLLPRAVDSALAGMAAHEVEVIVVPNGPDTSWQESLSPYINHPSLRILPIAKQHANAARNHGMRHARGKLIRFLDDDDKLYPSRAVQQYAALVQSGNDLCSADIDLLDYEGHVFDNWLQDRRTDDFTESICSHHRMQQVTAHVFRLDMVSDVPWDESLPYSQDICWLLDIVSRKDLKWTRLEIKVGGWHRHLEKRISTDASILQARVFVAERLRSVASALAESGRLSATRRVAIADGIWEQIHETFYLSPVYWWKMGRWADTFCPGSHPPIRMYEYPLITKLPFGPLVWEALTFPRRVARHAVKAAGYKLGFARWW